MKIVRMNKIQQKLRGITIQSWLFFLLSCLFVVIYATPYLLNHNIYNSPDETSVFVFTKHFAEEGNLSISQTHANPLGNIRPRSVNIVGGNYVPGSFIGLPVLLGYLGKVFGLVVIKLLPALFAVIAVYGFSRLIGKPFGSEVGKYTRLLFFFLAPWWHYASKGFLPNSLFISFLIIATWLLVESHQNKSFYFAYLLAILSGVSASAALVIRPSELWWLVICGLFLLIVYRRNISYKLVVVFLLSTLPLVVLIAYWQQQTFGAWYLTGYDQLPATAEAVVDTGQKVTESFFYSVQKSIFPFGLNLHQSFVRFWQFTVTLLIMPSILFVIGIVHFVKEGFVKRQQVKSYLAIFIFVSVYLVLYYGSWLIQDHPDQNLISIGISYMRYWLPIYVLMIPFCVHGLFAVSARFKSKKFFAGLFMVFLLSSAWGVYGTQPDNLGDIIKNTVQYKAIRQEIEDITPGNAIIISSRQDKIIWPVRDVIVVGEQDYAFSKYTEALNSHDPVYWLTDIPHSSVEVLKEREFYSQNLKLEFIADLPNGLSFYQLHNEL